MRGTINLAGQPSGAVSLSVAYNPETDACILLQTTNDGGQRFDLLLSALQAEKLADLLSDAATAAAGGWVK